ncbi:MAG TPA: phosphodiester glycosidase family protein [Gaiellaceae bacterium]|nr:phosphodiester glycosidase family protein [Gaiellaceae bacterium]
MHARLALLALLAVLAAPAPASAQGSELMPGVTYDRTVEFTPHGAVVMHVITAPRPGDQNGLYTLAPVIARGTITGGTEKVTQLERDVSGSATVAGIEGDLFRAADTSPGGVYLQNGVLQHPPLAGRSSIGIDATGTLRVERVRFFGTWQGTGQRRALAGVNRAPAPGEVVLFTPSYGARAPVVAGAAEAVFQPFPAATPNVELAAAVTSAGAGGGEPIPPGGAVLMATGAAAAKLRAEAPPGTTVRTRLILQPSWDGVSTALGGGPLLVRAGKPVFRSLEDFTNDQVTSRSPRAAVAQLADGRVLLAAVDGGRPGYSVGLTSFELAQALVRLGAVTAAAVAPGDAVTMAFDGKLLNRPSGPAEQPAKEALLVQYYGVYAPPPSLPLATGEPGRAQETLAYKVVRPSTVTAALVGPDGESRPVETGVARAPGVYTFPYSAFDREGTWHWHVVAIDDLGRTSTADRAFRFDTTLRGLTVSSAGGVATARFTLSRSARVRLQIETATGVVLRALPDASLGAGARAIRWDGRLPLGTRAYAGAYFAHFFVSSDAGSSDLAVSFTLRR